MYSIHSYAEWKMNHAMDSYIGNWLKTVFLQESKNHFLDPMMFFKQWQGHIVWSVVESDKEAKTISSIRILVANRKASCRVTTTAQDQNHLVRVSPSGNSGTVIGETEIQNTKHK